MSQPRILLVDDDPTQTQMLQTLLQRRLDVATEIVYDGESCLEHIKNTANDPFDLVLLDLSLPNMSGFDVLEILSQNNPDLPVIIITGSRDISDAGKAIRLGAVDFITKPIEVQRILVSVQNALKISTLNKETTPKAYKQHLLSGNELIGKNGDLSHAYQQALKAAHSNIPVHLCGETGVGKEVMAQIIHQESKRCFAPFVTVNCGALPENLIESLLFGHEKGSFTGAVQRTLGKFREAQTGTIFLDEIGELPASAQVKLLRVLQEKEIDPIGATRPVPIDVRIISATNRNLQHEVAAGRFREDLYYRLNILQLDLPPLRARPHDLPLLIQRCIEKYCLQENKPVKKIARNALERLLTFTWPGNIRQLENVIYRAVVLSDHSELVPSDFHLETTPSEATEFTASPASWRNLVFDDKGNPRSWDAIESDILAYMLDYNHQNVAQTAHDLGLAKSTLYRKIK